MVRRLVVGWDGSQAAAGALQWAVRHRPEAERVEIVEVQGGRRRNTGHELDPVAAAEAVEAAHPQIEAVVLQETGDVARALAARSAPDALVVLGGRGHEETRLGHRSSTAYRVVLAADGPVAVVPHSYVGGHDVVVGVTSRSEAACVVLTAAGEAARRHQKLVAVHVARPLYGLGALPGDSAEHAREVRGAEEMLHDALAPVREAYPKLPIVPRVPRGRPADVLLVESRNALLLVLGRDTAPPSNGRPVTQSSMLLSRAPVMTIPPNAEIA